MDSVCIHLEGVCSSSVKSGYERKTEDCWRQNFSGKVFEIVSRCLANKVLWFCRGLKSGNEGSPIAISMYRHNDVTLTIPLKSVSILVVDRVVGIIRPLDIRYII